MNAKLNTGFAYILKRRVGGYAVANNKMYEERQKENDNQMHTHFTVHSAHATNDRFVSMNADTN